MYTIEARPPVLMGLSVLTPSRLSLWCLLTLALAAFSQSRNTLPCARAPPAMPTPTPLTLGVYLMRNLLRLDSSCLPAALLLAVTTDLLADTSSLCSVSHSQVIVTSPVSCLTTCMALLCDISAGISSTKAVGVTDGYALYAASTI